MGTSVTLDSETRRDTFADLLAANLKRAQQAARTLEECTKTVHVQGSQLMEQLRYSLYEIDHRLQAAQASATRLSGVAIYALIDGCSAPESFVEKVERLLEADVDAIQLETRRWTIRACWIARVGWSALAHGTVLTFVNDRPDIAVLSGADGCTWARKTCPRVTLGVFWEDTAW